MSRLVQELPQIISWIWILNTVDCRGGKSSAKVRRRCVFCPVKNIILFHMFWGFQLSESSKKVVSQASISCEDLS